LKSVKKEETSCIKSQGKGDNSIDTYKKLTFARDLFSLAFWLMGKNRSTVKFLESQTA
jgi:hypothetical protein